MTRQFERLSEKCYRLCPRPLNPPFLHAEGFSLGDFNNQHPPALGGRGAVWAATPAFWTSSELPDLDAVFFIQPHGITGLDAKRFEETRLMLQGGKGAIGVWSMGIGCHLVAKCPISDFDGPELCPREEAALFGGVAVDRPSILRMFLQILL